jgi:hypothetical protein
MVHYLATSAGALLAAPVIAPLISPVSYHWVPTSPYYIISSCAARLVYVEIM